jgi:hypothetical protein
MFSISAIHVSSLTSHSFHHFFRTSTHRLAELFVDPMINSGEERERFKEIVQNMGDTLDYMDKVQHVDEPGNYEDVSRLFESSLIVTTVFDTACGTFCHQAKAHHDFFTTQRMSTNWLGDKRGTGKWNLAYDSSDDDELDEQDWLGPGGNKNYDYEEEMPTRGTTRKYKDKYSHDSDSSDGEDPELADDDEMVATKTGTTRKRIPTKKRS